MYKSSKQAIGKKTFLLFCIGNEIESKNKVKSVRYIKNKELLVIIIAYIFITMNLIIDDVIFYTNVINPLFWTFILVYLIWDMKKGYIRFCRNKRYFKYMIIISFIHTIVYFYMGFIFGFSKSPYNHAIISILKNIIIQIVPIIGIEVTRSVIATRNKDNKLLLTLLTILLILVEINYNTVLNLFSNKEEFFEYICEIILPQIAGGILYTYLTLKGSYSLTLLYRFLNELVVLLLPILPDLDWFMTGSEGILSVTLIYLLFKYRFTKEKKDIREKNKNLFAKISYILTLALSITLVCFMLGIFKYEPITILSNSMIPTFSRGDVIIYKKITDKQLKELTENSIIIYNMGEQNIAHRIVNTIEKSGTVSYQTKGDSNNAPDINLVETDQIQGIYIFHIKYIGFPSVWLYDYFHDEDAEVEIK